MAASCRKALSSRHTQGFTSAETAAFIELNYVELTLFSRHACMPLTVPEDMTLIS